MLNSKFIVYVMGLLLIIESSFMMICAGVSLCYGESDLRPIVLSALITFFSGLVIHLFTRGSSNEIGKREGYVIVTLVWVVFSLFGSLPFVMGGYIPSYTDAFFETMSGFTTTGASVLSDIEALPHGILFWRSMTHLVGGMGILVLTVAILPIFGIGGMSLFNAEAAGITTDKLHPRIKETAQRLWGIYMLLIGVETIFLMFGGMTLFDALCHSFGTLASGGFSTKNDSAASFSPYIQYVLIVFMIIAGTNFTLHYFALNGKWKRVVKNQEFKVYLSVILFITVLIGGTLVLLDGLPAEKAFRDALFQVSSVLTSTGFVSADYTSWHHYLWFLIFSLMFVGGCVGSTSGGVKLLRQYLLFRNSIGEFKRMIHPSAVIPVRYNGAVVSKDIIFKVLAFFMMYLFVFFCGCFVMTLLGMDFVSSMGAVATTMGGIGPGLGSVGPVSNFAGVPQMGKWVLSFLMLLGRLELFTVLIIFAPSFWKHQ